MGDNITVAVHVGRIREKIEDDPAQPQAPANRLGRGIPAERGDRFNSRCPAGKALKIARLFG